MRQQRPGRGPGPRPRKRRSGLRPGRLRSLGTIPARIFLAWALLPLSSVGPAWADGFRLSLPVDCTMGEDCHIQQYMDRDPGEGHRDFQCRGLSYDGHKGTDFAVPTLADMTRGVDVLAAADGQVTGLRDKMPDTGWTDDTKGQVKGRECGNGVLLAHPGGWETQYCHLRSGSIAVVPGQRVERGDLLGQIGLSGRTEFPHLHLSVRRDGVPVDPFDPDGTLDCASPGDSTLWEDTPLYRPGGVVALGVTDHVPTFDEVKTGLLGTAQMESDAAALVVFGLTFGTLAGDIVRLSLQGPDGEVLSDDSRLARNHAQAFRAVGKRLGTRDGWPPGGYRATVKLIRDNAVIGERTLDITIATPRD